MAIQGESREEWWTLYFDGAWNAAGSALGHGSLPVSILKKASDRIEWG